MKKELINYRLDDIALLYTVIHELEVGKIINKHMKVHHNWSGCLPGDTIELWLCYIMSAFDHRLCSVEEWAEQRIELLGALSGIKDLTSYDFSDDKLGLILGYSSKKEVWQPIEKDINSNSLRVYRLEELGTCLNTFRLDAAPMQSYGQIKEDGLLQRGYHKHHANLGQFKVKLCTLDNELNNFAFPVCHLTVAGNLSDDELYIPIISGCKQVLGTNPAYAKGNLFVGDNKLGSIGNRVYIVKGEDYYLMPLSLVQLSQSERMAILKKVTTQDYQQVWRGKTKGKIENILVAEGFEVSVPLSSELDGKTYKWTERRLFVHSLAHAQGQEKALERRIKNALDKINDLSVRKQGKAVLNSKKEYKEAISKILKDKEVEEFIDFNVKTSRKTKTIRAYGNRPQREERQVSFELSCWRKEAEIKEYKQFLGWQVYGTNAPKNLLPYEKCVWKYRYQSNIESRFDDLRNKMAALLPVFLQKDNRIEGLVNILLLVLKICTIIEYKTAKALQDKQEQLHDVYEGNPKRGTDRPSAKRLLNAFVGISISLIFVDKKLQFALMTQLEPVQRRILQLLGIKVEIYTNLSSKIEALFAEKEICFSQEIITET